MSASSSQPWLDSADDSRWFHAAAQASVTPPALETLERAEQQRRQAEQDRARFWAVAAVPRERLVALNTMAEDFFTGHYADTWAADYLRERLGTDLVDDPRVSVGYAPDNWTALTTHLRRHGATDTEILAAGLGVPARTGTVVDRFRDRLVFPIKAAHPDDPDRVDTLGFIARRNPSSGDDDNAGPKYLNTADTDLFTKGHALYGLADFAAARAAGATPVLVEEPMDALAVTLAGTNPDGSLDYVGVAPLGTAFTDTQADMLRRYLSTRQRADGEPERAPIVVATDNDRAGHQAAHRAFWRLAGRGEDPRHLLLPPGTGPAELLHNAGPAVLRAGLDAAAPLAEKVIADRTAVFADRLDTIEGRLHAARRAADVIAALPATSWLERATATADQFGVAQHTVLNEVLDRGHDWTEDPRGLARQRVAERLPEPARPPATPSSDPTQRWAALAATIGTALACDPHWPVLAEHLTRAEASGYDVANRLTVLIAHRPLDGQHTPRDLDLRLISDCPGCLPPTDPAELRDTQDQYARAAAHRMAVADQHTAHRQLQRDPKPTPQRPTQAPSVPRPEPAAPREQPGHQRSPAR